MSALIAGSSQVVMAPLKILAAVGPSRASVLSLNPWMGDFVLPSTRLFWDAAECGAVGRG
nr:hypothetical protein [Mycobacterium xenopi]